MANLGNGGFDANQHEPVDFSPIPAGKYLAAIVESEMKATKDGAGHFLYLVFQILEGQYKGRKLFDRLNLHNAKATAVAIAKGQLSAICRAVNVMTPKDSQELHSIPLSIDVRCVKREDTSDINNEIKGYARRDGSTAAPAANSAPQSAATNGGAAPWKR